MCSCDLHKCILKCLLKKLCIRSASGILRCLRIDVVNGRRAWEIDFISFETNFHRSFAWKVYHYPFTLFWTLWCGRIACRKTLIWIAANIPPHSPPCYIIGICWNCEVADILFTVLLNSYENYSKMKKWMYIYVNRYELRIINRILSEDEPKMKDIIVQVENVMVLLTIIFNDWKIFLFLLVDSRFLDLLTVFFIGLEGRDNYLRIYNLIPIIIFVRVSFPKITILFGISPFHVIIILSYHT